MVALDGWRCINAGARLAWMLRFREVLRLLDRPRFQGGRLFRAWQRRGQQRLRGPRPARLARTALHSLLRCRPKDATGVSRTTCCGSVLRRPGLALRVHQDRPATATAPQLHTSPTDLSPSLRSGFGRPSRGVARPCDLGQNFTGDIRHRPRNLRDLCESDLT